MLVDAVDLGAAAQPCYTASAAGSIFAISSQLLAYKCTTAPLRALS